LVNTIIPVGVETATMTGIDSGIKMHPDSITIMEELTGTKKILGYLILTIKKPDNEKHDMVVVAAKRTRAECEQEVKDQDAPLKDGESAVWYCFRKALEGFDIAYGGAFFDYESTDKRQVQKLVWVTWNPDDAKPKDKMKYSSTNVFKKYSSSFNLKHQAADSDDVTYKEIGDKFSWK